MAADGEQAIAEDARLMQRIAMGDAAAWRILARQEMAKALLLAQRILQNDLEAEEVVQEGFARLYQQAPHWQARARVATWLYRVIHNLAMDRCRQRRGEVAWDDLEEVTDPAPSPLARLERLDRHRLVSQALAHLPPRQREALILVYTLGLSTAAAATVMAVGPEAIASLLARGRRQMRLLLQDVHNLLQEP